MKRFFLNGIFVLMAAFGLIFISCQNGNTPTSDEWTKVSSVNEMAGKWRNSFVDNVPSTGDYNASLQDIFGVSIPSTSIFFENCLLEYAENGETLTVKSKLDFNLLLDDVINVTVGYTKDSLWENLVSFYDPIKDLLNVTIGKYYLVQESTSLVVSLDISSFYINGDRTKLKIVIPLTSTYKKELILNKTT
ncbi:MAG: hypothetical protein LBH57_06795 [Treponema sp.]|jgi:hypothetical protein|nr:hypothetical protein [Treponema sp.]